MSEREVYFNEFNILMENTIFLPIVSGQLRAYAESKSLIKQNYQFMPFLFIRNKPDLILAQYHNPSVAAFSCYMWNMNLSLAVARRVKAKFPNCLVVFGGHQVPYEGVTFLEEHPFIDATVRGEGERVFADILEHYTEGAAFTDIPSISYRDSTGECIFNNEEYPLVPSLDVFPSPYLEGFYDYLLDSGMILQPIIETNRGCPYRCSFCSWSGENTKLRFFSLDRINAVLDWCGAHKMKFVLCADANFGIVKRDFEVAKLVVRTKERYGYPEIFRCNYGKNSEDTMYRIAKLLNDYGMTKAVSMTRQSNSLEVLRNIRRDNIRMEVFDSLQRRYNKIGVPTSTDIILGLPGESYKSFVDGLEEILEADFKSQLLIYPLQIYPNTELSTPEYRERFGIQSVILPLNEVHGSVHTDGDVWETEEMVVSTNSMSVEEWKRAMIVMFITQLFHSLKLGFFISLYLFDRFNIHYMHFYEALASGILDGDILNREVESYCSVVDMILDGKERGQVLPEFSDTYWEVEEASYLRIAAEKDKFFDELKSLVMQYLTYSGIAYDADEISEVVDYQRMRIPTLHHSALVDRMLFEYNIPEYFDRYFSRKRGGVTKKLQVMYRDDIRFYGGDKHNFSLEVVVYGRKSEKMTCPVRWFDV